MYQVYQRYQKQSARTPILLILLILYTKGMFRKNRRALYFLVGIICALILCSILVFASPIHGISLGLFHIPATVLFFPFLFLTVYFFVITAFPSGFHGFLVGGFVLAYLMLRMYNLTNPLFLLLLLLLLLILEILLYKK